MGQHATAGVQQRWRGVSSAALLLLGLGAVQVACAEDATVTLRALAPETALQAAQAALAQCRKEGFQAAVAIVDRGGLLQVLLRDRLAGAHTVDFATQKAWSAASFKMPTSTLAAESQPGKPMSGMRSNPRVLAIGGGLPIEAAGSLLGAIGVSGAPGGDADERCAQAGLRAIAAQIEF